MTTDDERARKIAEAKARAEAARAARTGGQPAGASPPAETPAAEPTAAEAPVPEPVVAQAQEQPEPVAAGAPPPSPPAAAAVAEGDGADDRARKIAEAKARAEAARAAREGGAAPAAAVPATPPTETPAVEAAPAAAAASAAPPSADERARRIEEAKARAAAARAGAGKEPAATASTPAAAAVPAAASQPAAAAAPAAAMAPANGWKGEAAAPNRVLTARAETRAVMRRELQDQEVRNLYTRRSIVRTSFWAALGVTVAGLLLGFVNFFWPRQVTGFGGLVTIPASQVPPPGSDPKRFPEGKLFLVNLQAGEGVPPQFQALAAPSEAGGLLALWQKCPHLGCTVPWRPDFDFEGVRGWFRCPCHGSTYSKAGIRVFGPAPRPMDTFAVTVTGNGSVEVNTGEITPGGSDNPQRAVLAQ